MFNSAAPGTPDGHCTPCEAEHAVRATAVVPPVNPTVPPEPPSIPSAGTGTDVVGPLRWSAIFLTSGTLAADHHPPPPLAAAAPSSRLTGHHRADRLIEPID